MALTSDTPSRGKFSLTRPGAKEYLIVGGVVLAAALAYFWWKKRNSTAPDTADNSGAGSSAPSTPTGLSTADFLAWIEDHQGTTTTTTTGGAAGTTTGKTPDYWQLAIDLLRRGGNSNPTHAQIEAKYRQITPAAVRHRQEARNKAGK